MKKDIKNLTLRELEGFFASLNEKKYRAKEVFNAIYKERKESFLAITTLSKELRETLDNIFYITIFKEISRKTSKDDATKFVFELSDKRLIESVLIKNTNKIGRTWFTACLSTQVGCPLGCQFCATGKMGIIRNLETGEIVEQFLRLERENPISNIVFMGMGEPLLNYENVKKAIQILTDENGRNLGKRHITISTSGITPMIYKLADEIQSVKLAVSLHSAIQIKRDSLMPGLKNYPLNKLKEALVYYNKKTGNTVTLEYLLIDGINDSRSDAEALVKFSRDLRFVKVNLIHYNEIPINNFKPSSKEIEFQKFLLTNGLRATLRLSKGTDVSAACGQLATNSKENIQFKI
ncbi:MAG: 23S rRNA (adenine(2503)-C(2))-methyltransferase RlmN [Caldisericum sp.]|uniref:23S rRNA (adenine(2503)-C(2))-methyltransferase RlmN n=1 Tax=Caldisericum sp. TaxID=2499687 RepID=UPI003D0DDDC7